ncbi:MAG: hypothetical protein IMZ58_03555 [Thermoplasmata archaeon]|nr:hypothetical protein [Thermoplasmata archaeon]
MLRGIAFIRIRSGNGINIFWRCFRKYFPTGAATAGEGAGRDRSGTVPTDRAAQGRVGMT